MHLLLLFLFFAVKTCIIWTIKVLVKYTYTYVQLTRIIMLRNFAVYITVLFSLCAVTSFWRVRILLACYNTSRSFLRLPKSHHSRPPRAIFTTSGWPLLTHHGRPLSSTGFSSRVKNDNRHLEGCEVSHRNGWCLVPRSVHFCLRVHRAPIASCTARGSTALSWGG